MPVTFQIDPARRWLEASLSGVVSIEEVMDSVRRMFAEAQYSDDLSGIIDCRELENVLEVTELRGLADLQLSRPGPPWRSRRAVVVASPQHYATARMFMVFAEAGPVQYSVFYNMDAALQWLRE